MSDKTVYRIMWGILVVELVVALCIFFRPADPMVEDAGVDISTTAFVSVADDKKADFEAEQVRLKEEAEAEAKAAAAARAAKSYSSSSYTQSTDEGVLTRSGGVNYYNGRKETWYSQRVLPGGGLDIPGRHVAEDGTIRDEDGYICVAASDLEKGTVVETSLGTGKVYDSGCAAGTTDIYTDW